MELRKMRGLQGQAQLMKIFYQGKRDSLKLQAAVQILHATNAMKISCLYLALALSFFVTACASSGHSSEPASRAALHSEGLEFRSIQFKPGRPKEGDDLWSSVLDQSEARLLMDENMNVLRSAKGLRFRAIGWADGQECSGKECLDLAFDRAQLIVNWFQGRGISAIEAAQPDSDGLYFGKNYRPSESELAVARRVDIEAVIKP